ncbi:hypothetical protein [Nocardioides immobilis]|uniref:hypothetical protein n=1 Tax=Nocardioides immobilis TaxID=2049295 RepID=UPI0011C4571C|nr:hypothetical protein [Nocardioides immobilis]
MPKKIDPKVKERCARLVLDRLAEYPSMTAACESVARREGVGPESRAALGPPGPGRQRPTPRHDE